MEGEKRRRREEKKRSREEEEEEEEKEEKKEEGSEKRGKVWKLCLYETFIELVVWILVVQFIGFS